MSIKFNGHKILKQFSHRKWQIMLIFSLITSVAHFNFSIVCIRRVHTRVRLYDFLHLLGKLLLVIKA